MDLVLEIRLLPADGPPATYEKAVTRAYQRVPNLGEHVWPLSDTSLRTNAVTEVAHDNDGKPRLRFDLYEQEGVSATQLTDDGFIEKV